MRVATLSLALAVVACGLFTDPDTTIRVRGTVTAAADGSPIGGAAIAVYKMDWSTDSFIVGTGTDNLGHYSLSFVEEEFCPVSLFKIRARATGFQTVEYTTMGCRLGNDPTHIRCTEETQTIDFQLEQAP